MNTNDYNMRELERAVERREPGADRRLQTARLRAGRLLVAHVVQRKVGGSANAACDIRVAPAGVKVRGHGGRERATRVIPAAGQKPNMVSGNLRKHLDGLEAQGVVCPFLALYRWWRVALRAVGEGQTEWTKYFRSPEGKAKLIELTPALPEGTRV